MALTLKEEQALVQVLIYHYRKDSASCGCGWGEDYTKLGLSHAEHVVDVFKDIISYLKE